MADRTCVLLDGGFVKKMLRPRLGRAPAAQDVVTMVGEFGQKGWIDGILLRAYWYDADPYSKKAKNPINGSTTNFDNTPQAIENRRLLQGLELEDNFAVRRGRLVMHGWKLSNAALKKHSTTPSAISAGDLAPNFDQKGVDMRIGLDIARIALKRTADTIVLVTGDADFIPAMKLARIEGVRVYLHTMGGNASDSLRIHADRLLV